MNRVLAEKKAQARLTLCLRLLTLYLFGPFLGPFWWVEFGLEEKRGTRAASLVRGSLGDWETRRD